MEFNYALYLGKPQDRVFAQIRYRSLDAALQGQFNDPDLHGLHPLTVETPLARAFERQCRNTVGPMMPPNAPTASAGAIPNGTREVSVRKFAARLIKEAGK